MMPETHYQVLGIERAADSADIKKAYRRLAKKYHPDHNKEGEARFKKINEAYQILSDPEKRETYDFLLDHQVTPERLAVLVSNAVELAVDELLKTGWGKKIEAAASFVGATDLRARLSSLAVKYAQQGYARAVPHA